MVDFDLAKQNTRQTSSVKDEKWQESPTTLQSEKPMVKCARCGIDIERPMKEWNMNPPNGGANLHVKHYACPECGKTFRIADKIIGAKQ